jgi:hypothetical protein
MADSPTLRDQTARLAIRPSPRYLWVRNQKKKKPTGAKLRSWRFSILRSRAQSRNR